MKGKTNVRRNRRRDSCQPKERVPRGTASLEADLEATLRRVKAYRSSDPDFEGAIAKFAEAETDRGTEDPVEGTTTRAQGPAQRLVRELIRG